MKKLISVILSAALFLAVAAVSAEGNELKIPG